MKPLMISVILFLTAGCTGQIPPIANWGSAGPHIIATESTPVLTQVERFQGRQPYSLLVRTVKDARFEETVGQHYGGYPEKVVYSYIGDRLSHEVITEKLRNGLGASGFQITQGWGGGREPDFELRSELLKYAVYTRGGFRGASTVANVSLKVRLVSTRSQTVVFEDIVSQSKTVTSSSPELLNMVVDQTVVAVSNHPGMSQVLGPGSPPPTVFVERPSGSAAPPPVLSSKRPAKSGDTSPPPTAVAKRETGTAEASPTLPPTHVGGQQRWAVVVGIGKYRSPGITALKYTRNDAQAVYDYLIDPRGGGFPKQNVKLLLDDQATRVNILSALGTFLARSVSKNDMVVIFYAAHGAPETDYTRKEPDGLSKYLVPYDSDPEDLYATAIPMPEIQTIFDRIESDRLIFVADACYSGASGGRTFTFLQGRRNRLSGDFVDKLAQGTGRVILTAADANEVSLELDELKHGIFTFYLLEALRGKADINRDARVSIDEAYRYVYEMVSRHSKQVGGNQHPVWKGDYRGEIFLSQR
jgi:hypothetical protein